jgi:hypothetical protein
LIAVTEDRNKDAAIQDESKVLKGDACVNAYQHGSLEKLLGKSPLAKSKMVLALLTVLVT